MTTSQFMNSEIPEDHYTVTLQEGFKDKQPWYECIITYWPTRSIFYGAGWDNLSAESGAYKEMLEAIRQ
jgi:hypothetical protein